MSRVFYIEYSINNTQRHSHCEFGIDVFNEGQLLKSITSITENKNDIENIVAMCNELEIELCHLDDIIEDYLTDFCI